MNLNINNHKYTLLIGYQSDNKYRSAFNELTKKVFNLSFESWYKAGYWNDKYIPYTLFKDEQAIANLSVNIMDFVTDGKQQKYIQIGTVATDNEYRNQGLSRYLMERALEEWSNNCDFIYLYANNTVLDFYPKFGFKDVKEYEYFISIDKNITGHSEFVQFNMDEQKNKNILYDLINESRAFSKIAMRNADLVMFYCMSFMKDNIYYSSSLNTIVIATYSDKKLHIFDVFSSSNIKLSVVLTSLVATGINEVVLGFTPIDNKGMKTRKLIGDDTLFIQSNHTELFDNSRVMFPLLSHA